jgi:hypothetical protein
MFGMAGVIGNYVHHRVSAIREGVAEVFGIVPVKNDRPHPACRQPGIRKS